MLWNSFLSVFRYASASATLFLVFLYILFQKKVLPYAPLQLFVSRVFLYPTWPFTYFRLTQLKSKDNDNKPIGYWSLVSSHIFLGGIPIVTFGHVKELHAKGVRGVVNCCAEYEGPIEEYRKHGIKQLHFPIIDHQEPSVTQLQEAIAFINEHVTSGSRVYIHCKAGRGRSAAIVFCYLLQKDITQDLQEIQAELLFRRPIVRRKLYQQKSILSYRDLIQEQQEATQTSSSPDVRKRF